MTDALAAASDPKAKDEALKTISDQLTTNAIGSNKYLSARVATILLVVNNGSPGWLFLSFFIEKFGIGIGIYSKTLFLHRVTFYKIHAIMSVTRFGISIEQPLLEALDEYVKENFFTNRSQAIRQLISKNIVEKKWQCNNQVAGAITLLYDPKKREILNLIASELEKFHSEVLSSQRFMLEPDKWLEVVTVKGSASRLTELSDILISIKGLHHGKLSMSRAD